MVQTIMSFFKNLIKPLAPKPPPPQLPPVPAHLPKITAPTAAQICQVSEPKPAAQALLTPHQTPAQYLGALQEKHMGDEMVKTMAHGMPDREGVWWAAKSAEKVSGKLPPADVQAMQAAQTWVKNPTEANQAAAAAAAAKTDYRGPGALAAQGAAWAKPAVPNAVQAGAAATPRLTPHAVAGAVLLSSAIQANPAVAAPAAAIPAAVSPPPQAAPTAVQTSPPTVPPEVQAHMFKQQQPFIAMGMDVASGKNTWA